MQLRKCYINNYKSISGKQNHIQIDEGITTIIGKNESGKSNILEAIGLHTYMKPLTKKYCDNLTRTVSGDVELTLVFQFDDRELSELNVEQGNTTLIYKDTAIVRLEGSLQHVIDQDKELIKIREFLLENRTNRQTWKSDGTNLKVISELIIRIAKFSEEIIYDINSICSKLKTLINTSSDEVQQIGEALDSLTEQLDRYYSFIPQVYYRAVEKSLKSTYKLNEIDDAMKDKNDLLPSLLQATKLTIEDFKTAMSPSNIKGVRESMRKKIDITLKASIADEFQKFYTQEEIEVGIGFDTNEMNFFVHTHDKVMDLSERSNGLKWYLNLFIDIKAQGNVEKPTIYILDEPGVFLHVNAQVELRNLFKELTKEKSQLIFTTHSPFMVDDENITAIRAIEKDEFGITKIYNNVYDARLCEESKMETLSPLLNAIGADLKHNLGPQTKNNIITEGITDKMYLVAVLKYLGVQNIPNIIPLVSVSNTRNVMAILLGWGCEFKAVLDFDNQGLTEFNAISKGYGESGTESLVFVNGSTRPDKVQMNTNPMTIESLISAEDMAKLSSPYNGKSETKKLAAKDFYDQISKKAIELTDDTLVSFRKLFSELGIEIPETI